MDETTKRTMFPRGLEETGSRPVAVPVNPLPTSPALEAQPELIAAATGATPASAGVDDQQDQGPPTGMTYATRLPPDHPGLQLDKPPARPLRRKSRKEVPIRRS